MLCEICGKKRATVHVTEILSGKATEVHLCENCAKKKGMVGTQSFGITDLLTGLMDLGIEVGEREKTLKSCPGCGMTVNDFRKTGRFGCARCYETFRVALMPLLEKIHGSVHHFGKSPKKISGCLKEQSEIQQTQHRLNMAIEKEEFEKAVKLRDKIKELQKRKRNDEIKRSA